MQKGRRWVFTINNPDEDPEDAAIIEEIKSNEHIRFLVCELEHENEGTPHIQGYLEYNNATTRQKISDLLHGKAYVDLAKKDRSYNVKYCSKEFRSNNETFFDCKGITRDEIISLKDDENKNKNRKVAKIDFDTIKMLEIMPWTDIKEKYPDLYFNKMQNIIRIKNMKQRSEPLQTPSLKMKNYWLVGKPGIGKSSWVQSKAKEHGLLVYQKNLDKWWDGFIPGEHLIVQIDDFIPQTEVTIKAMMKRWADRGPLNEEIKGGKIQFNGNDYCLVVTSNFTISECYYGTGDDVAIQRRFLEINLNTIIRGWAWSIDRIPLMPFIYLLKGVDPGTFGIDLSDPIWQENLEDIHYTKVHTFSSNYDKGNWVKPDTLQVAARVDQNTGEMLGYQKLERFKFLDPEGLIPIYERFDIDTEKLERQVHMAELAHQEEEDEEYLRKAADEEVQKTNEYYSQKWYSQESNDDSITE